MFGKYILQKILSPREKDNMVIKNIKRASVSAAFLIVFVLMTVLLFSCKQSGSTEALTTTFSPEPPPKLTSLQIEWNGSQADPTSAVSFAASSDGVQRLTVQNGNEKEALLRFLFEGEVECTESENAVLKDNILILTLKSGESYDGEIKTFSSPAFLQVISEDFERAYLYSEYALSYAAENDVCESIVICAPITFDRDLKLCRPCTLEVWDNTLKVDGKILCVSESSGVFALKEGGKGKIISEGFFAEAPECDIVIGEIFDYVLDDISYYCRAKTLNGIEIQAGERKVTSYSMLKDLVDPESYPTLHAGDTIIFSGDYTVEDKLTFDMPLSFAFERGVVLSNPISVITEEEGTIRLIADDLSVTLPEIPILPTAPSCDFLWESCKLPLFKICSAMNVRSINGKNISDRILGGSGKAKVLSVFLNKSGNRNLSENIEWEADGYVLYAKIDCMVDPATLKAAHLTIKINQSADISFHSSAVSEDGGINLLNEDGAYFTLTDDMGNTTRYAIVTDYTPTRLPIIVIDTKDNKAVTSKEEYIDAVISINCEFAEGFSSLDPTHVFIRGRGNSTWLWEKKPYKLKFDVKTSVLNLPEAKKWTLLANYADKSLMRNSLAMFAAKRLDNMPFVPTQYPVDVFLNGKYVGVYSIGDQIEEKKGRVELENNPGELDTGYLLEVGGTSDEDTWDVTCFYTELMKYVKIHSPEGEELSKEQVAFIKDFVTKADKAVMAGEGYEEYIDVDSLIDWYIIHELSYNLDSSFRRSCFLTKDAGGKLKMGPIWDFDLAFGNFSKDPAEPYGWACLYLETDYIWTNWMCYLMKNEAFVARLKARWEEVKDGLLSDMMSYIDQMYELISPSAKYNFKVWDILNKRAGYEPRKMVKYNTYELQIQYLRDFINKRWNWMNENMTVVTD